MAQSTQTGRTSATRREKTLATSLSVLCGAILVVLKLVVGLYTGSVSILSEAAHSCSDLIAAILAFFSIRIASRPADREHSYGHGKVENLTATIEAVLIFLAAGYIIFESVKRIVEGGEVSSLNLGIVIIGFSALLNLATGLFNLRIARRADSPAMEGNAQHLLADVYTCAGVFGGLVLVRLTGWAILDPIVAIAVALFILKAGYDVLRRSAGDLLDHSLPEVEERLVRKVIEDHYSRFVSFHDLRTRRSGSLRHVDLHLVLNRHMSVEDAHEVCTHLEEEIEAALPRTEVTIHVEPCACQTLIESPDPDGSETRDA